MKKISELLAKHGVESAGLKADMEQLLTTVKSESIAPSRLGEVVAQRNELRADAEEKNAEITQLNSKLESKDTEIEKLGKIKEEFNTMKTAKETELKEWWNGYKEEHFELKEGDKGYDKMKTAMKDFVVKDEITSDEIALNKKQASLYTKFKAWELEDDSTEFNNEKPSGGNMKKDEGKNPFSKMGN